MTTIKKFLLCTLILNSVSLFSSMGPFNSVVGPFNSVASPILNKRLQRAIEDDKNDDFSKYHSKVLIEKLFNRIDLRHLGVDRYNCCCSHLIGSIRSYYKTICLPIETVTQEMQTIQNYIPSTVDQKPIFKELVVKHYYVYYLMKALIEKKIQQFEDATGSTIDKLYSPVFTSDTTGMNEIIHTTAYQSFFDRAGIENKLTNDNLVRCRPLTDIQFIVLYGHENEINPRSLIMSSDSKYLQSTDCDNKRIIWDIKKGAKADLTDEECNTIQWASAHLPDTMSCCAVDEKYNYYASSSKAGICRLHDFPIKAVPNKPAIILYERPKPMTYLCRLAFKNGEFDRDELIALTKSNSIKAIEGFPRQNLENLINSRLKMLK